MDHMLKNSFFRLTLILGLAASPTTLALSSDDAVNAISGLLLMGSEAAKKQQEERKKSAEHVIPDAEVTLIFANLLVQKASEFEITKKETRRIKKSVIKTEKAFNEWQHGKFTKNLEKYVRDLRHYTRKYKEQLRPYADEMIENEKVIALDKKKQRRLRQQEIENQKAQTERKSVEQKQAQQRQASLDATKAWQSRIARFSQLCKENRDRYTGAAVTIKKMNLTMCPDEMLSVIERDTKLKRVNVDADILCLAYTYSGNISGEGIAANCDSNGNVTHVVFSCEVTNTCSMSVSEIGQSLINNVDGIDELALSLQQGIVYEGRTRTGEQVKINRSKAITIERGLLGQDGPSF